MRNLGVSQGPWGFRSSQPGRIKCLPGQGVRQRDILGPGKSQWGYLWHQHQPRDPRCQQRKGRFLVAAAAIRQMSEDLNPRRMLNPHVLLPKIMMGDEGSPWLPACQRSSWSTCLPLMPPCLWQPLQLKAWANELMGSSNHPQLW